VSKYLQARRLSAMALFARLVFLNTFTACSLLDLSNLITISTCLADRKNQASAFTNYLLPMLFTSDSVNQCKLLFHSTYNSIAANPGSLAINGTNSELTALFRAINSTITTVDFVRQLQIEWRRIIMSINKIIKKLRTASKNTVEKISHCMRCGKGKFLSRV
jgi:hypothetical protein